MIPSSWGGTAVGGGRTKPGTCFVGEYRTGEVVNSTGLSVLDAGVEDDPFLVCPAQDTKHY